MKKIISFVLCLCICVTFLTPALAAESSSLSTEASTSSSFQMSLNDGSTLIAEDLPNGDARFAICSNGQTLSESYLNRADGIIYVSSQPGQTTEIINTSASAIIQSPISSIASTPDLTGYTKRGIITYNFYGELASGSRSLNVYSRLIDIPESDYNINGKYQDITSLAAEICSVLAVPASIASKIAGGVLTALGIALGAISITIEDHDITCHETKVRWLGQSTTDTTAYAILSGSKYVLTQEGYENQTYFSDTYWPLTAYANHDTSLASELYWAIFNPADLLQIVSWS